MQKRQSKIECRQQKISRMQADGLNETEATEEDEPNESSQFKNQFISKQN